MKKRCLKHSLSAFPGRLPELGQGRSGIGGRAQSIVGQAAFSSAFTLIELIITVVIAGIAIIALVMVFQESLKNMERLQGVQSGNLLAEELMNEIRSKKYRDPQTPVAGETNRVKFDSLDDYNHWTESPPKTIEGAVMSNFSGLTWMVLVTNVCPTNFNSETNNSDFKRITVLVSNAAVIVSNMSVKSRYD